MWETIKEIYLSVKKTSTDRIKSPFYGVFILTWVAFNWQPIAIVLFSNLTMEDRIGFINAIYPFQLWWPLGVSAVLAYALPFINEKFTYFQSKPISRTAVVLAIRRKRALVADISVEKYRAKRDVTYDRNVAGAEKEIQSMREENLASKKRMGEINAEIEMLKSELASAHTSLAQTKENADRFSAEASSYHKKFTETEGMNSFLKSNIEKSESEIQRLMSFSNEARTNLKNAMNQVEQYAQENSMLEAKLKDYSMVISSLENELNEFKNNKPEETNNSLGIKVLNPKKMTWRGPSDGKK
ncbi:hypothetical protein [Enterobacter asburiae]|uniref:hypothetical protein n=1 Tax=Enterobacter asburiae TaxID=61645 RepID=UPI0026671D7F|nr:hypothetical protein [Enterobacter asburiae]MDO2452870.1 hypothetical protein [Enterobacter asburiae]